MQNQVKIAIYGFLGLLAIVLIAFLWPFTSVPTGYRGVVTQFGKIHSMEQEGLVILAPWQKLSLFNVRSESAEIKNAQGSTADQQAVDVSLVVRYAISPNKVAEVFEKFSRDGDLDSYVTTATQEVFKSVTANYKAPELISQRTKVSGEIRASLTAKLAQYGAVVTNIDMTNFKFSNEYMSAINEKVTQEQKKLAAENRVKTIEAEQRSVIVTAEAAAEAQRKKADGDFYAVTKKAEAEANALKIQNAALASSKEVLELRRIEVQLETAKRWNGALPQNMYGSAPVPLLSLK